MIILHYNPQGAIVILPGRCLFSPLVSPDLPIQITPSGDDTRFFTIYSKAMIGQEV
ncbi:MAG: hypothetical protein KBC18_02055 [Candidatus Saccharicenans sp.]|nr:hypothetical protein [Candidatus Saccharicenans sp.]